MNALLERWNLLDASSAAREILPCCGSQTWAIAITAKRPFIAEETLYAASDAVWAALPVAAWQEAFDSHPRIGQSDAYGVATPASLRWSTQEQQAALAPDAAARRALEEANRRYEARFDRILIVCASGRSTAEILSILEARLNHDDQTELLEATEQQRQITQLRLRRWLEEK